MIKDLMSHSPILSSNLTFSRQYIFSIFFLTIISHLILVFAIKDSIIETTQGSVVLNDDVPDFLDVTFSSHTNTATINNNHSTLHTISTSLDSVDYFRGIFTNNLNLQNQNVKFQNNENFLKNVQNDENFQNNDQINQIDQNVTNNTFLQWTVSIERSDKQTSYTKWYCSIINPRTLEAIYTTELTPETDTTIPDRPIAIGSASQIQLPDPTITPTLIFQCNFKHLFDRGTELVKNIIKIQFEIAQDDEDDEDDDKIDNNNDQTEKKLKQNKIVFLHHSTYVPPNDISTPDHQNHLFSISQYRKSTTTSSWWGENSLYFDRQVPFPKTPFDTNIISQWDISLDVTDITNPLRNVTDTSPKQSTKFPNESSQIESSQIESLNIDSKRIVDSIGISFSGFSGWFVPRLLDDKKTPICSLNGYNIPSTFDFIPIGTNNRDDQSTNSPVQLYLIIPIDNMVIKEIVGGMGLRQLHITCTDDVLFYHSLLPSTTSFATPTIDITYFQKNDTKLIPLSITKIQFGQELVEMSPYEIPFVEIIGSNDVDVVSEDYSDDIMGIESVYSSIPFTLTLPANDSESDVRDSYSSMLLGTFVLRLTDKMKFFNMKQRHTGDVDVDVDGTYHNSNPDTFKIICPDIISTTLSKPAYITIRNFAAGNLKDQTISKLDSSNSTHFPNSQNFNNKNNKNNNNIDTTLSNLNYHALLNWSQQSAESDNRIKCNKDVACETELFTIPQAFFQSQDFSQDLFQNLQNSQNSKKVHKFLITVIGTGLVFPPDTTTPISKQYSGDIQCILQYQHHDFHAESYTNNKNDQDNVQNFKNDQKITIIDPNQNQHLQHFLPSPTSTTTYLPKTTPKFPYPTGYYRIKANPIEAMSLSLIKPSFRVMLHDTKHYSMNEISITLSGLYQFVLGSNINGYYHNNSNNNNNNNNSNNSNNNNNNNNIFDNTLDDGRTITVQCVDDIIFVSTPCEVKIINWTPTHVSFILNSLSGINNGSMNSNSNNQGTNQSTTNDSILNNYHHNDSVYDEPTRISQVDFTIGTSLYRQIPYQSIQENLVMATDDDDNDNNNDNHHVGGNDNINDTTDKFSMLSKYVNIAVKLTTYDNITSPPSNNKNHQNDNNLQNNQNGNVQIDQNSHKLQSTLITTHSQILILDTITEELPPTSYGNMVYSLRADAAIFVLTLLQLLIIVCVIGSIIIGLILLTLSFIKRKRDNKTYFAIFCQWCNQEFVPTCCPCCVTRPEDRPLLYQDLTDVN